MSESPLSNPKQWFQKLWRAETKEYRAELYARMTAELHAPFGGMVDRTLYTPPLNITTQWMKELIDEDNADVKVGETRD